MKEAQNITKGIVFDIQRFSLHDGPGIRTTIFLKGCPLDCIWCHNPEAKSFKPQISFDVDRCSHCSECSKVCNPAAHTIENGIHTIDHDKCNADGACVSVCPNNALKVIGYEVSVDDILDTVLLDLDYYRNSGGGLTISGGEPLAQFRFTLELLKRAREYGIHTAVETCGYVKSDIYKEILPYVDLFLYDYKATGPEKHRQLTGESNELILNNLSMILENNARLILRCPLIPGVNDTEEHLLGIADLYKRHPEIYQIQIMPFHNIGKDKAVKIGSEMIIDNIDLPDKDFIDGWISKLESFGCSNVITG